VRKPTKKERAEFEKLKVEILCHQFRYYVLSHPTISDYAYDELEKRAYTLECLIEGKAEEKTWQGKPSFIISSDNARDYPKHIQDLCQH